MAARPAEGMARGSSAARCMRALAHLQQQHRRAPQGVLAGRCLLLLRLGRWLARRRAICCCCMLLWRRRRKPLPGRGPDGFWAGQAIVCLCCWQRLLLWGCAGLLAGVVLRSWAPQPRGCQQGGRGGGSGGRQRFDGVGRERCQARRWLPGVVACVPLHALGCWGARTGPPRLWLRRTGHKRDGGHHATRVPLR